MSLCVCHCCCRSMCLCVCSWVPCVRHFSVAPSQKCDSSCGTGDVIVGLNDYKVAKPGDLARALDDFKVGDRVTLRVQRGAEASQVWPAALTPVCNTARTTCFACYQATRRYSRLNART